MNGINLRKRIARVALTCGIVAGVLAPAAAFADYPNPGNPPTTPKDPGVTTQVKAATTSSSLPFTGADVAGLAAIGGGAAAAGAALVMASKRRRHATV